MVGSSASLGFVRAGFIFVKSPCRRGFSTKRWKGPTTELPYHEQVQTNAVDERFEESCRYIDEMSYSQQASEIGVRLDGHALLLQVCHRAPSVPGAATLRKKSHRGNNRTQVTSQGLSYFVTTMHLLFYLHDIVLLFVCDCTEYRPCTDFTSSTTTDFITVTNLFTATIPPTETKKKSQ